MSNIKLNRDNKGELHMIVGDQFAVGSKVVSIQQIDGLGLTAIVWVPLKEATIGEVTNVVPFARPK